MSRLGVCNRSIMIQRQDKAAARDAAIELDHHAADCGIDRVDIAGKRPREHDLDLANMVLANNIAARMRQAARVDTFDDGAHRSAAGSDA